MMSFDQSMLGFLKTQPISLKSLVENIPNFDFFDENSSLLNHFQPDIPKNLMLGKRAERFFSAWIEQSADYDFLAENCQVIDQKQTLGEFDFFVRRKSDRQVIHVELVYKFYVFDPSVEGTEIAKWIGPNRGDRLENKLDKLTYHQFPLLHSEAGNKTLQAIGLAGESIEQQVLFLANLFVPTGTDVHFNQINAGAVEGNWFRLNEWLSTTSADDLFVIPPKNEWFRRLVTSEKWLTRQEVLEQINIMHSQNRSPLVFKKGLDERQSRHFVVWW